MRYNLINTNYNIYVPPLTTEYLIEKNVSVYKIYNTIPEKHHDFFDNIESVISHFSDVFKIYSSKYYSLNIYTYINIEFRDWNDYLSMCYIYETIIEPVYANTYCYSQIKIKTFGDEDSKIYFNHTDITRKFKLLSLIEFL